MIKIRWLFRILQNLATCAVWFRRSTHALQLHDFLATVEQESVRHRIFWHSRLVSIGHLWQQGAGRSLAFRPSVASVFGVLPHEVFGPHSLTSHPNGRDSSSGLVEP